LCQELRTSENTWLEKRSPKNKTKGYMMGSPRQLIPLGPGEQNPSGSPEFVAVSPYCTLKEKEKMSY
jgi:hypothetical protein